MPRPDLAGSLTKLEWAQLHVRRLELEIGRWANFEEGRPIRFKYHHYPSKGEMRVTVDIVRQPWFSFGLIFGDAVNNYRAALDHLARELVATGESPDKADSTKVQFPICKTTREDFFRTAPNENGRLPGVRISALHKISPFQPYRSRMPWHISQSLLRLAYFSNRDKHRELTPTILQPYGYWLRQPRSLRVGALRSPREGTPFEPGAEIMRLYMDAWEGTPPNVRVDFDPSALVAVDGVPILSALEWIGEFVSQVLNSFVGS